MNYSLNSLWGAAKDYQITAGGYIVVNVLMLLYTNYLRCFSNDFNFTLQDVEPITCISFHPLGDFLVMGTNSPVIRLYDINTVQCYVCSVSSHQHTGPVTSVKYIINNMTF